MLDRIVNFFTSLKLTVVLLGAGVVLVFVGTLAQVDLGLYNAQNKFFRSLFVYWTPQGGGLKVPVLPGGYLIGGLLFINLLSAHARRFKLTKKKIGINLIHAGIVLMLVGQFASDLFQVESYMRLSEGQSRNYSESGRQTELAVIDVTNPNYDEVVAIPQSLLHGRGVIQHPKLPFTIQVKDWFVNSRLRLRAPFVEGKAPEAVKGIGRTFRFEEAPEVSKMDAQNSPSATVEIVSDRGSEGVWDVTTWATDTGSLLFLQRNHLLKTPQLQALTEPQKFDFKGRTYEIALRPKRYYKTHNIQLLQFTHQQYKGTDIPKNFASRVRVQRPDTGEDREVLIYMNNPLRYGGETYYQAGFDEFDPHVTILQVVRNPGWLTPYFSCVLVALGLIVQFLSHLIGFAAKWRTA